MSYKLGSLFDGSGGFPLAGSICGIEPCWASEVEPYPIAVTRERFPNMKHLGDISKINGAEIEPVDIITFGSPCQDLSVAGKRAGLKHEANGDEETTRSGLFMEAVRIIKEMRAATNGQYPRFALWENVPGAFSSNKGEDFRVVCEELIKIVEPSAFMPEVPKNGWAYADSYVGDGWSLAYRVFDAQYWGVPQRRRRIHLVADFRGERAREVLFEREGVRGYFTQGRTPWQTTPAYAEGSPGADDSKGEGFDGYNGDLTGDVSATLGVNCDTSTGRNGVVERGGGLDDVDRHILDDQGGQQISVRTDGKAPTLRAETHGNLPCVMEPQGADLYTPVTYQNKVGSLCARDYKGVGSQYVDEDKLVVEKDPGAVAYSCDEKMGQTYTWEEQANTLAARDYKQPQAVAYCVGNGQVAQARMTEKAGTLNCMHDQQAVMYWDGSQTAGTLTANNAGGCQRMPDKNNFNCLIERSARYIVRRLTPTECARLQGFADQWGHIEKKDSLTDEELRFWQEVRNTHAAINDKKVQDYTEKQMVTWYNKLHTDSAEYKMWGNGIALPPALYCMQGIVDALNEAVGEKHELSADLVDDLNRQNSEAVSTVMDFITEEPVAESEGTTEGEATDLSDAPEEIKQEILENDEKLEERSAEKMGHYEPIRNPLIIPTDEAPTEAPKSESRELRMKDEYIKILQDKAAKLEKERDTYRLLYNTLLKSITEGVGA